MRLDPRLVAVMALTAVATLTVTRLLGEPVSRPPSLPLLDCAVCAAATPRRAEHAEKTSVPPMISDPLLREAARPVSPSPPPPSDSLNGVVTDVDGNAIADAMVRVFFELDHVRILVARGRTDREGRFAFASFAPPSISPVNRMNGVLRVVATRDDIYGDSMSFGVSAREPVEVVCLASSWLEGRVLDQSGRPVEGASVELQVGECGHEVITDDRGCYLIEHGDRGMGHVTAELAGVGRATVEATLPDGSFSVTDLILAPGLSIEGMVVDGEGRGVVGLALHADRRDEDDGPRSPGAWRQGSSSSATRTDDQGRFAFRGLRAGRYDIEAPDGGCHDLDVAFAGDVDRRIVVRKRVVEIAVHDAAGREVRSAPVVVGRVVRRAIGAPRVRHVAAVDVDGRGSVLLETSAELLIQAMGLADARPQTVAAGSGGMVELVFTVK